VAAITAKFDEIKEQIFTVDNKPAFDLTLTTDVRKIKTSLEELKISFDQAQADHTNTL